MRILIVEDELDLQKAIADGLRMNDYAVDTCDNGKEAYELLYVENYDLCILDLNLPQMSGLEVLSKIRHEKKELKIIILSARSSIEDKIKGLDVGANDYLAKPFDFSELEARIRCLLRQKYFVQSNILTFNEISLDMSKKVAKINHEEIKLTRKEFAILEYFLLNQSRVITAEELLEHIWDASVDSFSCVIRVHISSLRKKLKALLGYDIIKTKIGVGYSLLEKGDKHNA